MKQRAWLLAVVLVTMAPMTARADQESGDQNRAAAGQAYREGQRQYDLNDFAKALDLFKRAYTLYDEPALLYNIAQCYRQLGDEEQAIKFYKSYLRRMPSAPNRDDVTRLVAGLEKSSNEKRASSERQRAESDALAKQRAQADAAERAARAAQLEADANARRRALELQTTQPVPRQPVYKKWWLWTTVALVAAAGAGVGVGVYYGTRPAPFNSSLPAFQLGLSSR
jgi:tetratricopeptide (TPR) repeat protein